jgi:hypothetical protein
MKADAKLKWSEQVSSDEEHHQKAAPTPAASTLKSYTAYLSELNPKISFKIKVPLEVFEDPSSIDYLKS